MTSVPRSGSFRLKWIGDRLCEIYSGNEYIGTADIVARKVRGNSPSLKSIRVVDVHSEIRADNPQASRRMIGLIHFLMKGPTIRMFHRRGAIGYQLVSRNPIILRNMVKRYPFHVEYGEYHPVTMYYRMRDLFRKERPAHSSTARKELGVVPKQFIDSPFVMLSLSFKKWEKERANPRVEQQRAIRQRMVDLEKIIRIGVNSEFVIDEALTRMRRSKLIKRKPINVRRKKGIRR